MEITAGNYAGFTGDGTADGWVSGPVECGTWMSFFVFTYTSTVSS